MPSESQEVKILVLVNYYQTPRRRCRGEAETQAAVATQIISSGRGEGHSRVAGVKLLVREERHKPRWPLSSGRGEGHSRV